MFSYLQENFVLILAVAGAVISFTILFIEKVARRQKIRLLLILAALGLLILTGQQVIEHLDKKNRILLEETRANIVEDIRKNVIKTRTIVEQLSEELTGRSPLKKLVLNLFSRQKLTNYYSIPRDLQKCGGNMPIGWSPLEDRKRKFHVFL